MSAHAYCMIFDSCWGVGSGLLIPGCSLENGSISQKVLLLTYFHFLLKIVFECCLPFSVHCEVFVFSWLVGTGIFM